MMIAHKFKSDYIQIKWYMRIAGADTGFVVRGGVDKIIEAGGLGAALRAPRGFRAKPWWGLRG